MSTLKPDSASAAPRFMTVVVFPTPPFWFATAMTLQAPACPFPNSGMSHTPDKQNFAAIARSAGQCVELETPVSHRRPDFVAETAPL